MNQKKIEGFLKEYGDMYGSPVLNIQKLAGFLSSKGCVVGKQIMLLGEAFDSDHSPNSKISIIEGDKDVAKGED